MFIRKVMTCLLGGLLVLWSGAASAQQPGGHLNITQVFVDDQNNPTSIMIIGEDLLFGPRGPTVTLGEFGELEIVGTPTDTLIEAVLPDLIPTGDYLLTVAGGNGQSQNDEYDLTIGVVVPPTYMMTVGEVLAGDFNTHMVMWCDPGDTIVSGGVRLADGGRIRLVRYSSLPVKGQKYSDGSYAEGWKFFAEGSNDFQGTYFPTVEVHALCLDIVPLSPARSYSDNNIGSCSFQTSDPANRSYTYHCNEDPFQP